jgi:hypothetical protein
MEKTVQEVVDTLTEVLKDSKSFHKVIIYGDKTNVVIEKPVDKQEKEIKKE